MIISVCILYIGTVRQGNGLISIINSLREIDSRLVSVVGPPGWWPLFSLVFLTSIAPFAMPHLMQKFIAIKDERSIKIGMGVSTLFAAIIGTVAYFVGATTRVFLNPGQFPELFTAEGSPIFDRLMPGLLNNVVPGALSVIILLLILSASMSTLASLVLLSSSTFAKDFYAGFINRKISDKALTKLMRAMSAVFIFLAVILAFMNIESIVAILGVSWGAIGSFFLGPFIWGLLSRRVNRIGALSSGLGGLTICLVLYIGGFPSTQAGTIGMIASLLINPLVSLVSNKLYFEKAKVKCCAGERY
jgi:Na+/pantothenate symporter